MTAEQLWQTTMDPERRTLLSVKLEDIAETETIFTTLMGEDVEARREVHRRQRARRQEPGHLVNRCSAGALARVPDDQSDGRRKSRSFLFCSNL